LKLNCTHQGQVYADDVNKLGGILHSIKKNREVLVVASRKTSLEVNAEKLKTVNDNVSRSGCRTKPPNKES